MIGFFVLLFLGGGLIIVRMLVWLVAALSMRGVGMRMNMLMLVRMDQVAMTMLVGVLVRVFMHVGLSGIQVVAHTSRFLSFEAG